MTENGEMAAALPDPDFARRAAELAASGDPEGALLVANEGAERFPWYVTGLLRMGECYEATGNTLEAILAYRKAARLLPDAPVVLEALIRLESEQDVAYQDSIPAAEEAAPEAAPAPGEPPQPPAETPYSDMEDLARQLEQAKRIAAPEPAQPPSSPEEPLAGDTSGMMSATLAEIYVDQGQFGEAIRTYRVLVERHPDEADRYAKRIEEIEEMVRKQLFE